MDDERDVERASLLSVETLVEKPLPQRTAPTPLPKLQIAILLGIQLAEPISSSLILPFINQLVQELGVTGGDDKKLGYYAGIIESMFFVAEASCVFQWGRLSDRIGRRPLLLIGTMGQILSAICFGMSKSYWAVIASRAFAGATNGNIGVVKTVMGELTDSTNVAQGFALMPMAWCLGATVGPFLGGTLSHPYERYPGWFGHPFWKEFPYLLPCLVAATYSVVIFTLALFFLRETRPLHRNLAGRDYHQLSELPDTPSTPSTPEIPEPEPEPASLRSILKGPLLAVIVNYNLLAVTEIAFSVLQPLVFATSVASGGLGLTPKSIGIALAVYGISNGIMQARAFPPALARLGPKRMFMAGVIALTLIFTTFPVMQTFARLTGSANVLVWMVIAVQYLLGMAVSSAYATVNIFMVATASRAALGATNGVVQTTTSVMRAVGPTIATSLYALSVERNILGGWFAYLIFSLMSLCCVYASTWLPNNVLRQNGNDEKDYD